MAFLRGTGKVQCNIHTVYSSVYSINRSCPTGDAGVLMSLNRERRYASRGRTIMLKPGSSTWLANGTGIVDVALIR